MKTILLKAEKRAELGTVSTKELRNAGQVPCVMYGLGECLHFAVYEADFKNLVYTPSVYKVKIDLDGKQYDAIVQDMQFHAVSENIMHADFLQIKDDKPVIMDIPVKLTGNSPGVRAGGKLVKKITRLRCKGLIGDFPDFIEVAIDKLKIGQSARVRNVVVEKLELLDAMENAVVSIKTSRTASASAVADDDEEEGAESTPDSGTSEE